MEQFPREQQVMFEGFFSLRKLMSMSALVLLAGCQIVPRGVPEPGPPPPPTPSPTPDTLPTDTARHRIALLVPLSGQNSDVGQSIANAATMALLDTDAQNLRITTYDTTSGAREAAQRAVADGNKLILGPLLSNNIPAVATAGRAANVPLISFSNDETAAARDVFVMGSLPRQSVERTIEYARGRGISQLGALIPRGEYGQHASDALMETTRRGGGSVVAMEAFDRSAGSVRGAAQRLRDKGGYDAILIADGGRMASLAAPVLKAENSAEGARILGTELWSGEKEITSTPALVGAWFSAVSDDRFGQFSTSYRSRFGDQPYRIATLGYDAVLLTLRVAQEWEPGDEFPTAQLLDQSGFLGLDGPFRFGSNGVIERALEVREVRQGGVTVVSPAPARF